MSVRPTPEQVLSLAPGRSAAIAATTVADPASWSAAGCDDRAVWGAYIATTAEPYEVAVDLAGPAFRCSCPSRKVPCKHCLGLLLLHANHSVAPANRLPFVAQWLQRRGDQPIDTPAQLAVADGDAGEELPAAAERTRVGGPTSHPAPESPPDKRTLERAERMAAGLRELDRWLADRVRGGLAAADLAAEATWERLAARLVDAQCGGLANRVRRVAAKVGQHSRWHEDVLEEMAILHGLAVGAQRTGRLPSDLADGVHAAAGLTVAKDAVLESVPTTAVWTVVGESRVGEGRITVQRTWLLSASEDDAVPRWALVLAFGAFGNEVETEHPVGQRLDADVHWYPAASRLRALVGQLHADPAPAAAPPPTQNLAAALAACGWAIAREPWLERFPVYVSVAPVPLGNGRWALVDATGSVPIVPGFWRLAEIVAASGGHPLPVMGEWTSDGILPLTIWTAGQVISL